MPGREDPGKGGKGDGEKSGEACGWHYEVEEKRDRTKYDLLNHEPRNHHHGARVDGPPVFRDRTRAEPLKVRPQPVREGREMKHIVAELPNGNYKEFRAPNHIPKRAGSNTGWAHILHKLRSFSGRNKSHFRSDVTDDVLWDMIMETSLRPDAYKVDSKTVENLLRFREYEDAIGYRGRDGRKCCWLVVVAKENSWIKTAYPVVEVFRGSTWNLD